MKKSIALFLTALLTLALLNCAAVAEQETVELVMWDHWTQEYLEGYIDEYNETAGKEAGIFVKWEYSEDENNTTTTRLMAANLAGTSPDIVSIAQMDLLAMANNGLLAVPPEAVQDYIAENYYEANVGLSTFQDVIWGYPTESQVFGLMYNADLLAEAGLTEPPKTWDELKEYAQKLTKYDENGEMIQCGLVIPFTFNECMHTTLISMFWSEGDELYPTSDTTNLMNETGVSIVNLLNDIARAGNTNANWMNWQECYANGKGAMFMGDAWYLYGTIYSTNEDVYNATRITSVPTSTGETGVSMLRGFNLCVPAASAHQQEAWHFLNWLNQADENGVSRMQEVEVNVKNFMPSMKTYPMPPVWLDEWTASYNEILKSAKPQPELVVYSEVQDVIDNMLDTILLSGADVDATMQEAYNQISGILSGQ